MNVKAAMKNFALTLLVAASSFSSNVNAGVIQHQQQPQKVVCGTGACVTFVFFVVHYVARKNAAKAALSMVNYAKDPTLYVVAGNRAVAAYALPPELLATVNAINTRQVVGNIAKTKVAKFVLQNGMVK